MIRVCTRCREPIFDADPHVTRAGLVHPFHCPLVEVPKPKVKRSPWPPPPPPAPPAVEDEPKPLPVKRRFWRRAK